MSKLKQDPHVDIVTALSGLFRSNKFSAEDLLNTSALLSQKGTPIEQQNNEMVFRTMLEDWGIGFDLAIQEDAQGIRQWMFDSISFLIKNPSIVGFLICYSDTEFRSVKMFENHWEWQKNPMEWERIHHHDVIEKIMKIGYPVYILWKQWIPLKQWISSDRPFFVRNHDTESYVRWEYEPTSCWLPRKTCYHGKDKRIAKILKKWSTPCLISNGKHVLVLTPGEQGWHQETVMEFDGLNTGVISDRLAGLAMTKIDEYINKDPNNKNVVMPYLAHAVMSVANKFGIKIDHKSLSAFQMDDSDMDSIREYDKMLSETHI